MKTNITPEEEARLAARAARKTVFEDTLQYCKDNKKTNVKTAKHFNHFMPTHVQYKDVKPTIIKVVNQDCVEVAAELSKLGRTCMLNMANAIHRGGGVVRGAMAQEEELCRRSNLWYGLRPSFYPLGDLNVVYSKNVKFFKDRTYEMMPEFKCDIVTVAAPNLIGFKPGKFPKQYSATVNRKVEQMLLLPYTAGCKNLVLSAFGCGAFRNNPVFISAVFKKHLKNLPYENIYFAILDDKNCHDNGFSNFGVFKKTLEPE